MNVKGYNFHVTEHEIENETSQTLALYNLVQPSSPYMTHMKQP